MPVAGSTTGRYSPSELALLPIAHSFLCVACLFVVGDIMSRIDLSRLTELACLRPFVESSKPFLNLAKKLKQIPVV